MLQYTIIGIIGILVGTLGAWPADQSLTTQSSSTVKVVLASAPEPGRTPTSAAPSQELLKAIIVWISTNFDVPSSDTIPNIQLASPAVIAALHYRKSKADGPPPISIIDLGAPSGQREVVSVYEITTKTIYLPEDWSGRTPAEVSVLVHETVHHLQNEAVLSYECLAASEKLAYEAQEKWLNLFGLNLEGEFQLDPFTLLVTSLCGY